MGEIWLSIPDHIGYEVSNLGRVRSIDRDVPSGKGRTRRAIGVVLKPAASRSGHLCVVVGRGRTRLVHQLVMSAFVGPRPLGQEVLHKDHQPSNSAVVNLMYGTRSENLRMDYDDERRRSVQKRVEALYPCGKRIQFVSISEAARSLGVTQSSASIITSTGGTLRKSKVRLHRVL